MSSHHEEVMAQIEKLKLLVETGVLERTALPALLNSVLLGTSAKKTASSSPQENHRKDVAAAALSNDKPYRNSASPETKVKYNIYVI